MLSFSSRDVLQIHTRISINPHEDFRESTRGYLSFVVWCMSMNNFLAVPYIDSRMPDVI